MPEAEHLPPAVGPHPLGHLQALALVGLGHKLIPAPAIPADAEEDKDDRPAGQQDVAHQEVLQIQEGGPGSPGLNPAEQVVAQGTGEGENCHSHQIHSAGLLPAPAGEVNGAGDDILKHRQHGGQGGKGHEHKEQAAPQTAQRHLVEDIGQGDKDQGRAAVRLNAKGKAGREDNQAGCKGHKCIQNRHIHRLAQKSPLPADVAAEDGHGANAQAQGEEGLVHGAHNHVAQAHVHGPLQVGHQVEGQALRAALHKDAVDGQDYHNGQEGKHHKLAHPLQAVLQAHGADGKAGNDHHQHIAHHGHRVAQHLVKQFPYPGGVCPHELACGGVHKIVEHPAGHRGVEHHEQIVARHGHIAVEVPLGALGLQLLIEPHRALPAGPAHGKLHGHDRQAHDNQEKDVNQHKGAAAVLAHHVGELPDIANPDGASRADQDKAQPAPQQFSLHFIHPLSSS